MMGAGVQLLNGQITKLQSDLYDVNSREVPHLEQIERALRGTGGA